MGNLDHRDNNGKNRIYSYIQRDKKEISSCYYHIGRTTIAQSIFFVSKVVPITEKYIDRAYTNFRTNKIHIIKNQKLISELHRKLFRILAWEKANPNCFEQHITDIKNFLLNELEADTHFDEAAATIIESLD